MKSGGLINAYLAPTATSAPRASVRHIGDLYASTFRIPYESAFAVQRLYEGLAQLLLYQPVHPPDPANPVDNHALVEEAAGGRPPVPELLRHPITTGERPTIVRRSLPMVTRPGRDRLAGRGRPKSIWSDRSWPCKSMEIGPMELHEVYQNQTGAAGGDRLFQPAQSAVLTGLWRSPAEKEDMPTARHARSS
jgi:hypothetical protein